MILKVIRKVNDRFPKVINAETGEAIENIAAISYTVDAQSCSPRTRLEIVIEDVEMDSFLDTNDFDTSVIEEHHRRLFRRRP